MNNNWQPIETAPKGVKLIVGYPNDLGSWRTIMAAYYLKGWYEESETCDTIMKVDQPPTHWMPLPDPPVGK